ncbi:MAG: 50S ribosomal protein L32 [Verrucomicrobia bacterium]|jgi:large subunit ribosomal protein L32|nr:50S ribosomal protein L32 [Verrucomicrobiota bacterium]
MAVPKRKTSKSKCRMRKRSHESVVRAAKACPECGAPQQPHRVCAACGQYNGKQVLTVETD